MGIYFAGRLVPFYGICIALGIIAAGTTAYFLTRHRHKDFDMVILLASYGLCGSMVGAKLLYLFVNAPQIQWDKIFDFSYLRQLLQGGYVFYGGLGGGFLALFLGSRIHKIRLGEYLETCIPCIPIAHGFGRIGCHLAGCCYGIPYDGIGNVVYHEPSFAPTGIPLFPVQLVESMFNFALALFLITWIWRKKTVYSGIYVYLLSYSFFRFIAETFLRDDVERGQIFIFSTSQWISIFILVGALLVLLHKRNLQTG